MGAPEYSAWREYGFDYVTLQPNFAFHNTSAGQRFADVASIMSANELGVELELPDYIRNPQVASWQDSFTTYLDHVSAWPQSPMKTYYFGNAFVNTFAANASNFEFYQQLYYFVKGNYTAVTAATATAK